MQIPSSYFPVNYTPYNYGGYPTQSDSERLANGCETCDNRAYMDKSSDSTVSMQTPTKLNPAEAASAVIAHEMEHIRNDRLDAESNGRDVVSQTVRLHYDICRECGVTYVAGGSASTTSKGSESIADKFNPGVANLVGDMGDLLDTAA
jgi:hypothetical protein